MRLLSKSLITALPVLFLASSLTVIETTSAQVANAPSVPQFTLKLVRHVLEPTTPPEPSIDPFTGKQTILQGNDPFYWITIDITITNQAYNGKTDSGFDYYTGMMYAVEYRGHFAGDWTQLGTINNEGGPYFTQKSGATTLVSADNGVETSTPYQRLPPISDQTQR
jgi:hypothetical protein